ncbi:MAG TPA: NADH-quinone oxidoreductase subunit N [Chitinophagaceae bacterium]|jgi:NADH-quinone oxidoreductase subunit N|nr:NADH-quinone oxidoreductase subunit N [Chitinophagaceae bacterium]
MPTEFLYLMKAELMITVIIFILLFLKLGNKEMKNESMLNFVNILLLINLASGFFYISKGNLFGEMFRTNELITLEKNFLNLGTLIISLQSYHWLKNHKHVPEFYMLLLSTLLGMFFMISSGNLLMFYLGLELSTIPLAALSNFDLDKRRSSEAAFKMIISSAFSSGLLLFGISLLYGSTGTLNFAEITTQLNGNALQIFSFILLIAGFGFKISAVPFHLWTADVYEGSPVAVTSYLSVISKGAILFVMVSVFYNVFTAISNSWYNMIFLISIATMIIGNLFALRQQNMKRFLAFSSIAQVGFILVGLSAQSIAGSSSVIYFILIYIFSNLGAFGVISSVSAITGKENMNDYKGFYKTNPLLTWVLAISLFSLAGIPPMAGFFGKFFLLFAGAGKGNYLLIVIAALNMVVSLYYYLKVIKAMFMDANENSIEKIKTNWQPKIALAICVGGILITGIASGAYNYIHSLLSMY